jgi:hypothetical protein
MKIVRKTDDSYERMMVLGTVLTKNQASIPRLDVEILVLFSMYWNEHHKGTII